MVSHIQPTSPHALVHASSLKCTRAKCWVWCGKDTKNLPKSFHYLRAWYLATPKSATRTEVIHPITTTIKCTSLFFPKATQINHPNSHYQAKYTQLYTPATTYFLSLTRDPKAKISCKHYFCLTRPRSDG
jgi:hypothetical protein